MVAKAEAGAPKSTAASLWTGLAVVAILMVLLVTLPPVILDVGLTLNLSIALTILLVVLYVRHPLEISTFPTILLLATLFRLSLNIASTRLILLNGDRGTSAAGNVIEAFGDFVVGGSFLVGLVVFLLFVIINFVVITKGSGRIAEVAARFTLDAMPGKQMAIDADLNNGTIDDAEARSRREKIQREADFYGAMDGASKFVRGDAIAGLLITGVNILGGLAIGTLEHDLALSDAFSTYTLLTVGDGLVTAIPSLLISVAAGVIVTRAGGKEDLGAEILEQLWGRAKPLGISAGVLGVLALVPGLPHVAFGCLAAGLGLAAYRVSLQEAESEQEEVKPAELSRGPERPADLLRPPDPLELEIGYGLIDLVDPKRNGELIDRIRSLRREFAESSGFPVPLVHIRDNLQLQSEDYRIRVRGVPVATARVFPDQVLAIAPPGGGPALPGQPTTDPAFGLPAFWVKPDVKEQAQTSGYTVVDAASAIVTHLTEMIRRHAPELLGRQQVQEMLDAVSATQPKLVSELVPDPLPLGGVQKVLQNLLREGVTIRDLPTILETLADFASKTKDTELLTELVRERLAPHISAMLAPDGRLGVLVLAPELERTIASSVQRTEHGSVITLGAEEIARVVEGVQAAVKRVGSLHPNPGILCGPEVRPHVRRMIERFLPRCPVVSANELATGLQLESLGTISQSS
jgi:flagellar biosynthesis protein FlhA